MHRKWYNLSIINIDGEMDDGMYFFMYGNIIWGVYDWKLVCKHFYDLPTGYACCLRQNKRKYGCNSIIKHINLFNEKHENT